MRKLIYRLLNRETIAYVFWGISTTLINIAVYSLLCFLIDYKIANIIAIVTGKVYAYFVNKYFVFRHRCLDWRELLKEIGSFVATRGFSGVIDYFGVILLVEIFSVEKKISKYVITILVMIMNYIFGKWIVFKKKHQEGTDEKKLL